MNYTPYHIHAMYSNGTTNIDSVTDYKDYIDKAAELGMKAIAFSEHGNIFFWLDKKEYAEEKGLKYIHAVEAYITFTLEEKSEISISNELDFFFDNVMDTVVDFFTEKEELAV